MPRERQDRLVRQFFASMPVGAQVALYAGVFCCFAPLGLLQTAMRLQVVPWWEIGLVTFFSGSIAVVYAATATLAPRWMPLPIAGHLLLTFLLAGWLPRRPPILELDPEALATVATRLTIVGILTISSLMLAFVCFFTLIRREGLRFTTAHTEIRLARDIHAAMVPVVQGRTPSLEWRGTSRPSGDVGGDLVDVIATEGTWTAAVADVSGHGVAAGVLMGMFKTAFRTALLQTTEAGTLTSRINRVISGLRQPHMFITAAVLEAGTAGTLHYVLAGHPPMLHMSAASGRATWVGESQLALALLDDVTYESRTMHLAPGDILIVVTDGMLEVFDREDRELGLDGLRAAVERVGPVAPLADIETAVFEACRRHGIQTDDQTILMARWRDGEMAR